MKVGVVVGDGVKVGVRGSVGIDASVDATASLSACSDGEHAFIRRALRIIMATREDF